MTQPNNPSLESSQSRPALRGVEHAAVIDAIAHDPRTDEVTLLMVEARPWDGSELRLFQLQEKINTYLSFALDGEMAEAYPALMGKVLKLRLDCATTPDSMTWHFIGVVREQIGFQNIKLEVGVADPAAPPLEGQGGCGTGCGCA